MGAAASTESEKDDLRAIFSVFSSQGGSANVSQEAFNIMVKETSPLMWQKMYDTGDGVSALLALQTQLEGARIKLQGGSDRGTNTPNSNNIEHVPLTYEWAKDTSINLQKGLLAGMLSPTPLPRVKFIIGEGADEKQESIDQNQISSTKETSQKIENSLIKNKEKDTNPEEVVAEESTSKENSDLYQGRLLKGTIAKVKGIVGKPQTNNLEISIEDWDASKGRYLVKFLKSQKLALLKPENVFPTTNSSGDTTDTTAAFSSSSSSSQKVPFVVTALVDSGSEHSAISPEAAKRCGISHLVDSKFAGKIGGIGTAQGHGRIHYTKIYFNSSQVKKEIEFSQSTSGGASHNNVVLRNQEEGNNNDVSLYEAGFDVFDWPTSAIDFDAILGMDFLARYGALIQIGESQLILTSPVESKNKPKDSSSALETKAKLVYIPFL